MSNSYGGDGYDVRTDLGTLNWSNVPIVLVELGNMRNVIDARHMTTPRYRAHVYARGVLVTGASTGTSGATALIASGFTGAGPTPQSRSQPTSCSVDTAYTIRPRPIHAWAAEHIAQCSPDV